MSLLLPELVRQSIYYYEWRGKIREVNKQYNEHFYWSEKNYGCILHIHHEHFFHYNWRRLDDLFSTNYNHDIYNYNAVFRKYLGMRKGILLGCYTSDFAVSSMQEEDVWLPKNYKHAKLYVD